MKQPYLIQRCDLRFSIPSSPKMFSDIFELYYMGNAEYEFGAVGESLRRLAESELGTHKLTITYKGEEQTLRILAKTEAAAIAYVPFIHELREDKIRTKAGSAFGKSHDNSKYNKTVLWWDLDNDVMWSFHKPYFNKLPMLLKGSLEYMNALHPK